MSERDSSLETLEEAEPLDVLDIEEDDSESAASGFFSSASNPFSDSIFPVLFIDKKLRINYANPACEHLFTGFFNLRGNYFIDVFGRSFEMEDIKKIREVVLTGENAYSWKGKARVKSRDMVTLQVRVYIFPAELNNPNPCDFIVLFDDVTEDNKELLRA
ncbi:MAG: PAS domain-containing protein, partial [Treponema sp.]|nr:PAS domain-containing protein [Treponema sp.]